MIGLVAYCRTTFSTLEVYRYYKATRTAGEGNVRYRCIFHYVRIDMAWELLIDRGQTF